MNIVWCSSCEDAMKLIHFLMEVSHKQINFHIRISYNVYHERLLLKDVFSVHLYVRVLYIEQENTTYLHSNTVAYTVTFVKRNPVDGDTWFVGFIIHRSVQSVFF